jgi:hypothetical protein
MFWPSTSNLVVIGFFMAVCNNSIDAVSEKSFSLDSTHATAYLWLNWKDKTEDMRDEQIKGRKEGRKMGKRWVASPPEFPYR